MEILLKILGKKLPYDPAIALLGIYPKEITIQKRHMWGFPDGSVVKNPLANSGDMGLIPGPGRSHMLWDN